MKKKATRGFTVGELFVTMFIVGAITLVGLYFIFSLAVSKVKEAPENPMVSNWASALGYTVKGVTCQSIAVVARCTVRVEGQEAPFSLDCNTVSQQCSLTPAVSNAR